MTKLEKLLIAYDNAGDKKYSKKSQDEYLNLAQELAEWVCKLFF